MRKRIRETINRYLHRSDKKRHSRSAIHTRSLRYECLEQRQLLSISPNIAPPSDLTAVSVGTTSIALRWMDNSNNETGFVVEKVDYDNDSFEQVLTTNPSNPSTSVASFIECTVEDLVAGEKYWFAVKAVSGADWSYLSNVIHTQTLADKPTAPANLKVDSVSPTTVNLSWTNSTEHQDSIIIERSNDGGDTFPSSNFVTLDGDEVSYCDSTVTSGVEYYYRVRGHNGLGDSPYSNRVRAVVESAVPATPTTNYTDNTVSSCTLPSNTEINLIWRDNSDNESGFQLQVYTDGDWRAYEPQPYVDANTTNPHFSQPY